MKFLLTVSLTIAMGFAAYFLGKPIAQMTRLDREHLNIYLLVLGGVGLVGALMFKRHRSQDTTDSALTVLALLLPTYAAFQLLPFPLSWLRIVSPSRTEMLDALSPLSLQPRFAPISTVPALTLEHFLLLTSYAVVFLIVRDIVRSRRASPWLTAFPILAISMLEAMWGIAQTHSGLAGDAALAHGSFSLRNHFAGFIEMSFPFAVAYAAGSFGERNWRSDISPRWALRIGMAAIAAALMYAAVSYSLSRMGILICTATLVWIGIFSLKGRFGAKTFWSIVAVFLLVAALALVFLSPIPLILRFAESSSEGRVQVWQDTLRMIKAYPLFGCGLGGYATAFEKYKTSAFGLIQDYAHNDYLQYLSELGAVGFTVAVAFFTLIAMKAFSATRFIRDADHRWIGPACTGSLAAILMHSAVDFNLYVPVNAMLLAWVCGIAAGLPSSRS